MQDRGDFTVTHRQACILLSTPVMMIHRASLVVCVGTGTVPSERGGVAHGDTGEGDQLARSPSRRHSTLPIVHPLIKELFFTMR